MVPRQAPFFGAGECAVDEALPRIDLSALLHILRHDREYPFNHTVLHPFLESPVAGALGRIPVGQIRPAGAGLQDPEDPLQNGTVVSPGASLSVEEAAAVRDYWFNDIPLLIGEIHMPYMTAYLPKYYWD